ncbi:hypothetical protein MHU86_9157 [Fragilaria crotonensis]|nr:hypothetical protein MHU86_9157 [Fragilaria crotonensis]
MQIFANWPIQQIYKPVDAISIHLWTISALSVTFPPGLAKSLIFGPNKYVTPIHLLAQPALYNLIFTNISEPCQKHIIDGPPDARTAIFTLRRHCAPLTPDHIERSRSFCSIKQPHNELLLPILTASAPSRVIVTMLEYQTLMLN